MQLTARGCKALGVLATTAYLALASPALAYPQFQFSTGADTCVQCHFSPGGGGLINMYGRDESGSTISPGGNGAFLLGAWTPPAALSLGFDARFATAVRQQTPSTSGGDADTELLIFPMQGDLYVHAAIGRGFALYAAAGLRANAREPDDGVLGRLGSREHYLQYSWDESGHYARAGRFFPVFGVRTQDHTAMVRRYLDMSLAQEPYAIAVGRIAGQREWHAQLFAPSPTKSLGLASAYGATGYYERRNAASTYAWAAQASASVYDDDRRRATLGTVQKWWLPESRVLFLHELNVGVEQFVADEQTNAQLSMYLSATKLLLPGWMLSAVLHGWDPDVMLRANSRGAAEFNIQWFFKAHYELHFTGRAQVEGLGVDNPDYLALLQFHYYL
ncbi:MAG: hypothetical protein IPL79_01625 [Myxococcales bacterium]|nr:hypothetical protein [Myxococcales bacterium]